MRLRAGKKWRYLAGYILYFALGYTLTAHFHLFEPRPLPLTSVDRAIPFLPWTVWIYLSEYLLFFLAAALINHDTLLRKMVLSFFICFSVSFVVFLLFPTTFPREALADGSPHGAALAALWQVDRPFNCFPSLHVALTFLVAFSFVGVRNRWAFFFFLWSVAIALSTMTTKQHYFVDVMAGFALAALVVPLVDWLRHDS